MNDISFLEIKQCIYHLGYNEFPLLLTEALLSSESLVEVAILSILKDHIDIVHIVEVPIQLHYVGVVQSPLNFQLSFHLAEKVKLFQHVFEDHFQSYGEVLILLNCFVDFSKFA